MVSLANQLVDWLRKQTYSKTFRKSSIEKRIVFESVGQQGWPKPGLANLGLHWPSLASQGWMGLASHRPASL